jgi:hypothetical protein
VPENLETTNLFAFWGQANRENKSMLVEYYTALKRKKPLFIGAY